MCPTWPKCHSSLPGCLKKWPNDVPFGAVISWAEALCYPLIDKDCLIYLGKASLLTALVAPSTRKCRAVGTHLSKVPEFWNLPTKIFDDFVIAVVVATFSGKSLMLRFLFGSREPLGIFNLAQRQGCPQSGSK